MFTAADFAPFAAQEPLRTHRACQGTGLHSTASGPAHCFACDGTGQVHSPADSARAKELGRRKSALRIALRERAEARGGRNGDLAHDVQAGYDLLETREPARLPALYASLANGRVDQVITALAAYYHEPEV